MRLVNSVTNWVSSSWRVVAAQLMRNPVRQHLGHLRQGATSGFAALFALGLAIAGCAEPTVPEPAIAIDFEELDGATRSRSSFNEPQRLVIGRPSDLLSFWTNLQDSMLERHTCTSVGQPPTPCLIL